MKSNYSLGLPPVTPKSAVVSLDLETFNQGPRLHRPTGDLALAAINQGDMTYLMQDVADLRLAIKRIEKSVIAMHHAPYDLRYLEKWGVEVHRLRVWDTEIGGKLYGAGLYGTWALNDLARRDLDLYLPKEVRDDFGGLPFQLEPKHLQYAADDAAVTRRLAQDQMLREPDMAKYYWEIEHPALHAMLRLKPIQVDVGFWTELYEQAEQVRDEVRAALGWNPGSWQQIKDWVWKAHKIKLPNTEYETLEQYRGYVIVDQVLRYKDFEKAANTYGRAWLESNLEAGDLVYPDWNSRGTETGRPTAKAPSMTQIPVRKRPEYRQAFVAGPGNVWIKSDADQQEPRCMAYFSQDANLLELLRSGASSHLAVGREIFGIPDMTKKHPKYALAKQTNLAAMYNGTAETLARDTGLPVDECQGFIDRLFKKFPGYTQYHLRQKSMMQRLGYVRSARGAAIWGNLFGDQADNNAVNAPIQSTAAEITKRALVLAFEKLDAACLPSCLNAVVYDEIDADCPRREAKPVQKIIDQAWLEAAAECIPGVPFVSEAQVGRTWGG